MSEAQLLLPERVAFRRAEAAQRPPLRRLFEIISRAEDVDALKTVFIAATSRHFEARRAALMLFAEHPWNEMKPEMRENPVVRYLFERHAPVHEAVILSPGEWKNLCPWSDHGHVLTGPIVSDGELMGALGLTRAREQKAFNEADLADASALCLHLSAWFARQKPLAALALTPRERQITELVAQGLTNAQIGARLCVSAETVKAALKLIFRKSGVHSRAQLAAQCAATHSE